MRGWVLLVVGLLLTSARARAQDPSIDRSSVPAELAPWIDWVRKIEPNPGNCRYHEEVLICVWPTNASIVVGEDGGSFELEVVANAADVVALIGDDETWPQDVRVDGEPALVVDEDGSPQVRVDAGQHRISGRFVWRDAPEQLRVPESVALVELTVRGVAVSFPRREGELLDIPTIAAAGDEDEDEGEDEGEGEGEGEAEPAGEPEPDSERVEVSRLLADGVPLEITTRVDLRVSGQARELILPNPIWPDAKLVRIDSDLPVALDEAGQLVVQARSGTYQVTLTALLPDQLGTELAPPELAAPWPADEVWVWRASSEPGAASIGQVAITGTPVDRTRTHAPTDWPEGATYTVSRAAPLRFEILQRGVVEAAASELKLRRIALLDLAGQGWFVRDAIEGNIQGTTRLELRAGQLGSALLDGRPQVITVDGEGHSGVELRSSALRLDAQWRQLGDPAQVPLAGWSEPFTGAEIELQLPRGWDLLRVSGPGRTRPTWLDGWEPLVAIALLGACLAIGLWIDRWAAVVALAGLTLLFNPYDDGFVALLILLAALAGAHKGLQRERGPWATRGLRALWWGGLSLLIAWLVVALPHDLARVWQHGDPALGGIDISDGFETVVPVAALALLGLGALAGIAVAVDKLGARIPKLAAAFAVVGGLAALVLLVMLAGSLRLGDKASPELAVADEEPPPQEEEEDDDEAGGGGQRHKGEEGKMGRARNFDPEMDGRRAGVVSLTGEQDGDFLASPYGGAFAVGNDGEDVWGGITGQEVGEAYGVGGLGLVGTGRGGGGTGEGTIGLGNTGLIGKGGGGGTGSGYGRGSGAGFGGRGAQAPQIRQGKAEVRGALDRDIIRRIVRAHINEVRSCYNAGLTKDPDLGGKVKLQFVIGADGKVDSAVVSESTLADSTVGSCMAKAVKRWTFPKPSGGGTVTVDYPFTLESFGGPVDAEGPAAAAEAPTRYLDDAAKLEAPPPEIPQTGEADPIWSGRSWIVTVERGIEPDDKPLELLLVSPLANKLIALVRALTLAGLALLLAAAGRRSAPALAGGRGGASKGARPGAAAVGLLIALVAAPAVSEAAPPKELLDELSDRVNRERDPAPSPDCGDACALVAKLEVEVGEDGLRLAAEVHMAGPGVYEIPGPLSAWAPSTIEIDGEPAAAIVAMDNRLLVRMDEGLHRVVARGPLAGSSVNLTLPIQPKRVEVEASGWTVTGVDERDTATNLELLREGGSESAEDPEQPEADPDQTEGEDPLTEQPRDDSKHARELPVWLTVERVIEIGPRWSVTTTVRRVNEGDTPVKVRIPLLDGEQLIESSRKLEDPKATVTLERGQDSVTWTSVLDTREQLVLAAPTKDPWTERWVLICGAAWQCDASGTPASAREGARSVYHPWPGESLEVALVKPSPAEGPRLSVDQAALRLEVDADGTTAHLSAIVRSATVGERTITIPDDARLERVSVDGKEIPTSKDSAAIRLTFQPGVHAVEIEWKQDQGWSSRYQTPTVSLGGEAMNASVRVELADDLEPVLLRAGGTGWGPIVWFWAWLLALVGVAAVLHRLTRERTPLKLPDWLLLGFGFPIVTLPLVVGWFVAVGQRKHLAARAPDRWRYNLVQLGVGALTLITLGLGILAARTMLTKLVPTLAENFWGFGETLAWYADRTDDALPQATIVSVPASLWRAVGIAWVGWLGWRGVAWFKWFKVEVGDGGWLRWSPPPVGATPAAPPEQLGVGDAAGDSVPRVTQLDGAAPREPREPKPD